jgi:hypothetical protein
VSTKTCPRVDRVTPFENETVAVVTTVRSNIFGVVDTTKPPLNMTSKTDMVDDDVMTDALAELRSMVAAVPVTERARDACVTDAAESLKMPLFAVKMVPLSKRKTAFVTATVDSNSADASDRVELDVVVRR